MKISHEVPLNYLKSSLYFNDYQYVLPCMFEKYSKYEKFMLGYRKIPNSFIICDNDLFEGVSRTNEELIKLVDKIQPDIFIIPDSWNDMNECLKQAKYWYNTLRSSLPKHTKLMGVLQGKTFHEFQLLYNNYVDLGIEHIAFNHSSVAYTSFFPHKNEAISKSFGRLGVINKLLLENTIKTSYYHHLLGVNLIDELSYYNNIDHNFIKSIDTSNPVILGHMGKSYEKDKIDFKPKSPSIVDIMELDHKNACITKNISYFRKILNS